MMRARVAFRIAAASAAMVLIACTPSPPNYLTDYPALNNDGTVNAVIEVSAGASAKFAVTADGTAMLQDQVDGLSRLGRDDLRSARSKRGRKDWA